MKEFEVDGQKIYLGDAIEVLSNEIYDGSMAFLAKIRVCILIISISLCLAHPIVAISEIPKGIEDPGRSVWIKFSNPAINVGLEIVSPGSEGNAVPDRINAISVWKVNGFLYLQVASWFTASDIMMTIEYLDVAEEGGISAVYDSTDETVINTPPVPNGVWKRATESINCKGTGKLVQDKIHLPDARFNRNCNGGDLRLEVSVKDLPISAIWLTAISVDPPLPKRMLEIIGLDGEVIKSQICDENDENRFSLRTANYELVFGATGLISIKEAAKGITISKPEDSYIPLNLTLSKGRFELQTNLTDMPVTTRVFGSDNPVAVEYHFGCAEMLQVILRIEKVDNEITRWQIQYLKPSPTGNASISKIRFPYLRRLTIGEDSRDDWFVTPGYANHGAGVYYNMRESDIPSMHLAMNWLSLYDLNNKIGIGLFLDNCDDLDIYQETKKDINGIQTCFQYSIASDIMPTAYVVIHEGDWHRVADIYRIVVSRESQPRNPAWAEDCDGWEGSIGNNIDKGFCFIPEHFHEVTMPTGLRVLHTYRAMYDGPWCYCGVYPYPNPYYGSVEELCEANRRVRDQGGRMVYYINYMLTMPDGPNVKRIGPISKSFIPENIPTPFIYNIQPSIEGRSYTGLPEEQIAVDRSLREWSDRDLYWAKWYTTELSADGIYWDQLSCIPTGLKETAWNLERITRECREINPDFVNGGEGVGQAHGRNLTFGLASAVFHRTELYRYVFTKHIVMDGMANGATNWGGGDKRFNVVFLNGNRFDGLPSDPTFRSNTMKLRQMTKQLLYRSIFRDTDGVDITFPVGMVENPSTFPGSQIAPWGGIQAKKFILNDNSSKIILVNTVNEHGTRSAFATIDTGEIGTIQRAWVFLWNGDLQSLDFRQVSNTKVSFEIPTTMQSTVILVNYCEPLLYPTYPMMLPSGSKTNIDVEILNLNNKAIQGSIYWKLPDGWLADRAAFQRVEPGKFIITNCEIQTATGCERKPYDLWCIAETENKIMGQRYIPISIVPSLYVEWYYRQGNKLSLTLKNLSNEVIEANVAIEIPNDCPVKCTPEKQTIKVHSRNDADIVFQFDNLALMEQSVGLYIIVEDGIKKQQIPIRLYPAVSNGNFEIDLAGDNKPEYWTTYDYSGKISMGGIYPLINLDNKIVHNGKNSLRIDLYTGSQGAGVSVCPLATMLFPNATYRITAYAHIPEGGNLHITGPEYQPINAVDKRSIDGWQKYETVFRTGSDVIPLPLIFSNVGVTPVWIDSITVENISL
jgi:hypothetical protein